MPLLLMFGALAFIQGIADPTEGLASQPTRALLKAWGRSDGQVTRFAALLAIPWALKPLYGLMSDFAPLAGSRRRGYLIAAGALAAIGFLAAGLAPGHGLLPLLMTATLAVAFADVAADALLIEVGGPPGLIGRLQAAQWGCLWAASILAGTLGGFLSGPGRQPVAFLICGGLSIGSMLLAIAFVRDPPSLAARSPGETLQALTASARSPGFLAVAAFLFLWNFNPYGNAILHLHMTKALRFTEQEFGNLQTLFAASCLAASVAYGPISRRIPWPALVRASIPLGIVSTLVYWGLAGPRSAAFVTIVAGLAYMTATLIQLELAARACPPGAAGTIFATLMAVENLATSLSTGLGGDWYEKGASAWGSIISFQIVVGIGAAFTTACWLIVPWLPLRKLPE